MRLTVKPKRIMATSAVLLAVGGGTLAATVTPAMAQRTASECSAHEDAWDWAEANGMDDLADLEFQAAQACWDEYYGL